MARRERLLAALLLLASWGLVHLLPMATPTRSRPPAAAELRGAWLTRKRDGGLLTKTVRARRSNAILSVSPNYYDFAYTMQLQDRLIWVRRGIAAELLIQIYWPGLLLFRDPLEHQPRIPRQSPGWKSPAVLFALLPPRRSPRPPPVPPLPALKP